MEIRDFLVKHKIILTLMAAFILLCGVSAFGMLSEDREAAKKLVLELEKEFECLVKVFPAAVSDKEKAKLSGEEELAWRIHDISEDMKNMKNMFVNYYDNEKKIGRLLDKMNELAGWIDEAFVYATVSEGVKNKWTSARDLYGRLEIMLRKKVDVAVGEKVGKVKFYVSKVNRVEKIYVLRELLYNFLGTSELEKFPFPEEKKCLDPEERGEHFIITWACFGAFRLPKPAVLRFEYKFIDRRYDGFAEETYNDAWFGWHKFTLKNVGAEFNKRGKIIHWRVVIIYDNKIVAEKKSAMWNVISSR